MSLPKWALDPRWWRHPSGEYRGDEDFVVHPCHRDIGWTSVAIRARIRKFGLGPDREDHTRLLVHARQVINTECDCLIQTPLRLIVVECKDKTGFSTEQRDRQFDIARSLEKLLNRGMPSVHVELSTDLSDAELPNKWTWADVGKASA